jgi:hypothetical protein
MFDTDMSFFLSIWQHLTFNQSTNVTSAAMRFIGTTGGALHAVP